MLEVESDKELLSCNTIVAREATLYLHTIYTLTGYEEHIVGGGLVVVIGEH